MPFKRVTKISEGWTRYRKERARKRRREPIRWLTYKRRVQDDVEAAFRSPGSEAFFTDAYISSLASAAKELDGWTVKVLGAQLGITLFLLIGVLSPDSSITLLGLSLKTAPGLRELLVVLSSSLTLILIGIVHARDMRLYIIEKVIRLKSRPEFMELALAGTPAAYNFRLYIGRQFQRWQFSTPLSKCVRIVFGAAVTLLGLILYAIYLAVQILTMYLVKQSPTLPWLWSGLAADVGIAGFLVSVLGVVVQFAPLSYRDAGAIKELEELKRTDPAAHQRRLKELFGE